MINNLARLCKVMVFTIEKKYSLFGKLINNNQNYIKTR